MIRTTSSFLAFLWLLSHMLPSCWAQGCNVVTVSGIPQECLRGACADEGCELLAGDLLNGDYVRVEGVANQMVDPLDKSQGQLPVYVNEETGLFLYYDAFYAYSLAGSGESEGWAIGESIGSVCTDDHGYCRCGNVPAACCTTGPKCKRYLAKQSSQVSGTACRHASSYDRRPPEETGAAPWKIMAKRCRCHYGCSDDFDTKWNVRGVRIRCKENAEAPDDAPVKLELAERGCPMSRRDLEDTDCRSDACQGCMYEFDFAGCQADVDSCQCSADDEPIAEDSISNGGSSSCTPCTLGGTRASCSSDAECCSGKCRKASGICRRYKETCRTVDKVCGARRESCSDNADCCSNRCRKGKKICA